MDRGRSPTKKRGVGDRLKNMRMPSPGKIVDGVISDTVSGLHRPLVSRQRMEDQETQKERQKLVQNNTVSELASLKSPFDIPLPKFKKNRSKSTEGKKAPEEERYSFFTHLVKIGSKYTSSS